MTKQERGGIIGEVKEDLGKEHLVMIIRVCGQSRATCTSLCIPER